MEEGETYGEGTNGMRAFVVGMLEGGGGREIDLVLILDGRGLVLATAASEQRL